MITIKLGLDGRPLSTPLNLAEKQKIFDVMQGLNRAGVDYEFQGLEELDKVDPEKRKEQILAALRMINGTRFPATALSIATHSGLHMGQVEQHLAELQQEGKIRVAKARGGVDFQVDGLCVWEESSAANDDTKHHPIQPLVWDRSTPNNPVLRYKENKIVDDLLEHGQRTGFGLNQIAATPYSSDDRTQLAQLIGYSHSGAQDLGYFSQEVSDAAFAMHAQGVTEDQARVIALRGITKHMHQAALKAFEILEDVSTLNVEGDEQRF